MAVGYLRSVQQIREVVDRCPQGEKVLHTMEMARPVVRRGRWFRHSIYPDGHVSMAALVCTGRHVVKWPEFRAFHD